MNIILTPFAMLLRLLYGLVGSYGGAIILFCLVVKIVLLPISLKGRKSMLAMSGLAEEQKRLQLKYGKDRQRYSEELQALYTREHVKPTGGCLWSMLPLPILVGLYAIVRQPMTYLMQLTPDEVNLLSNHLLGEVATKGNPQLTMAQPLFEQFNEVVAALPQLADKIFPMSFTFLGINLSKTPDLLFFRQDGWMTWGNIGLFLIPFISAVLGYLSMRASNYATAKALGTPMVQDSSTKGMSVMMPLMSLWICFTMPAGLGLYWIANNIFAILQELATVHLLKKHVQKTKAQKESRAEQEKERMKEQKKQAAEQRAKVAEENRRIQMERKLSGNAADGRVGIRAYARGRTCDPERYPVTEYRDPNEVLKEQAAQAAAARQQRQAEKQSKKKRGKQQVEPVIPAQMQVRENPSEQENEK